jgi:ribosomal protein L37AE/L43A
MTLHAAPAPSAGKRYFAMPACPQCGDTVVAPEASEHVSTHEVRHIWSCDTCGHGFATSVDPFRAGRARSGN